MRGDFHRHVDMPHATTRLFMDTLQIFGLQQSVSFATHVHGHCLDLFVARLYCNKSVFVADGLSDNNTSFVVEIRVRTVKTMYNILSIKQHIH